MLPYWLLFAYFAAGALLERPSKSGSLPTKSIGSIGLTFGAVVIALMIGFRYKVGADWMNYEFMYDYAKGLSLERAIKIGDPGYMLLNWGASELGAEIWAVDLISGIIFTWGLLRLAKSQPDPWLAMLVAVPYLITVVAMGYTRQAIAIGILMAGLASLDRNFSIMRFTIYVAAAALFHRTAIVVLPIVMFATQRNRLVNLLVAALSFWFLFNFFMKDAVDGFLKNYVQAKYSSQGAAIRVVMNVIPALLYLANKNRFSFSDVQKSMWTYFSLSAIILLILLVSTPSSTAIDRLALYVIPLQLVILSRLPDVYSSPGFGRFAVVFYSAAILFVWLNFAVHSKYWVPYQVYPVWDP